MDSERIKDYGEFIDTFTKWSLTSTKDVKKAAQITIDNILITVDLRITGNGLRSTIKNSIREHFSIKYFTGGKNYAENLIKMLTNGWSADDCEP